MSHVALGPATENRLMQAFAERAVITAEAAACLLGLDVKSLRALTDDGVIRAVRRGAKSSRGYTEGDIRTYLTESAAPPREPRPKAVTASRGRVVPFSQRKANRSGR